MVHDIVMPSGALIYLCSRRGHDGLRQPALPVVVNPNVYLLDIPYLFELTTCVSHSLIVEHERTIEMDVTATTAFRCCSCSGSRAIQVSVILFLLCWGCDDKAPEPCADWSGQRTIATAGQWEVVPIDDDPFRGLVSGDPEVCQPGRYGAEFEGGALWFGIDTVDCAYITVAQPSLARLCPGDTVKLRLWHFALTGRSDGYQVALSFDGSPPDLMASILVPMPGALLERDWVSDREIAMGEPVTFHLSNHGINSWGLLDIVATRVP